MTTPVCILCRRPTWDGSGPVEGTARVVSTDHVVVSIERGASYWERIMLWEDGGLVGDTGEMSEKDQRRLAEAIVEAGLLP